MHISEMSGATMQTRAHTECWVVFSHIKRDLEKKGGGGEGGNLGETVVYPNLSFCPYCDLFPNLPLLFLFLIIVFYYVNIFVLFILFE